MGCWCQEEDGPHHPHGDRREERGPKPILPAQDGTQVSVPLGMPGTVQPDREAQGQGHMEPLAGCSGDHEQVANGT